VGPGSFFFLFCIFTGTRELYLNYQNFISKIILEYPRAYYYYYLFFHPIAYHHPRRSGQNSGLIFGVNHYHTMIRDAHHLGSYASQVKWSTS
jgi:hypothetical protein